MKYNLKDPEIKPETFAQVMRKYSGISYRHMERITQLSGK